MNARSLLHLKVLCVLLVAIGGAAQVGEIIAQEQTSPVELRHGYHLVFFDESGGEITWEQFQTYGGKGRWEIRRSEPVSDHARMLLANARAAASKGRNAAALELFRDAQENAPGWLYPIYETAWMYMLQGDVEEAEKQYHRVNQLEPHGFLNSQQAETCLRLEREGKVKKGTYQRVTMSTTASRETAQRVLRGILEETPNYAFAWAQLAGITDDPKEALEAVENGLASDPDPFTRDALRVRRAILAYNEGRASVAVQMLEELQRSPDMTLAVEAQIKVLLPGLRRGMEASEEKKQ